jgi:hypothetical protein
MSDSVPVKIEPRNAGDQDAVIRFIVGIQQNEFNLPITAVGALRPTRLDDA